MGGERKREEQKREGRREWRGKGRSKRGRGGGNGEEKGGAKEGGEEGIESFGIRGGGRQKESGIGVDKREIERQREGEGCERERREKLKVTTKHSIYIHACMQWWERETRNREKGGMGIQTEDRRLEVYRIA